MSAYSKAFQALTGGRALRSDEAAALLAQLRKETGDELAAAVERELSGQFRRAETDTDAEFRRKRRQYGAAMRTVNRLREIASTRTITTHQRTRSTS
ncbi:hypothetical protein ACRJ4W_15320 [Streptomyces sp. GLT-R25]